MAVVTRGHGMVDLVIREVDDALVDALTARAEARGESVGRVVTDALREALAADEVGLTADQILERARRLPQDSAYLVRRMRDGVDRSAHVSEIVADLRSFRAEALALSLPDSTVWIRQDRDACS